MNLFRHVLITLTLLLIIIGIPVYKTGYFQSRYGKSDAISSASVVIEQPSGAYVVLINSGLHPDKDNLSTWEHFFRGEDIDFLFEDISCVAARGDDAGIELARSFQSRLPENQMSVREEDISLMLSKAACGKFDVIIMSKELSAAYNALEGIDTETVRIIENSKEN